MLSLRGLAQLLGVPTAEPHQLVRAASLAHPQFDVTVMVSAIREGRQAGAVTQAAVASLRERLTTYDQFTSQVGEVAHVRVLKGARMARHYPPWSIRQSVDVDLLLPDDQSVWLAAESLLGVLPHAEVDVTTVARGDRNSVYISLMWQAADPLCERPMRAELASAALPVDTGRGGCDWVPVDDPVDDLLLLLLESRERELSARDALDAIMLVTSVELTWSGLFRGVAELGLVPAYRALSEAVAPWVTLPPLASSARYGWPVDPDPSPRPKPSILHGYPLQPRAWQADPVQLVVAGSTVLRSRVGTFLLTDQDRLHQSDVELVEAELTSLDRQRAADGGRSEASS